MPFATHPMSLLTPRSLITSRHNLTYSYYLSPNFHPAPSSSSSSLPTLVFLHGYPDDAHMWSGALATFLPLPYRFVVFDLLGFGGSAKPVDRAKYACRKQAEAVAEVLGKEGVGGGVIVIGHDWGSLVAQRFYLYHRRLVVGLVLLSLAYQIPTSEPFDLVEENRLTTRRFGYPQWEYWNFFTSPDAPDLMRENVERFYEVKHGFFASGEPGEEGRDIWMREMFCVPGAMREYVTQTGRWKGRIVELKGYAKDPGLLQRFKERMCRDGFEGPVQYYHALKENVDLEDEREFLKGKEERCLDVPVLYVGETGDWVCRTELMGDAVKEGLVRGDLEEKVVEAGHWVLYEKPEEVAELIKDWIERKFPVKM